MQYPVRCELEEFGSIECAARRDMEGVLRIWEKYRTVMCKTSGMQGANYKWVRLEDVLYTWGVLSDYSLANLHIF